MTMDSRYIPSLRDIAPVAYGTSIAKGLAADTGATVRTAKSWYGSNRLPATRVLPAASGMDRRLARLEARLRLYRRHLRQEIENAQRGAVAGRARDPGRAGAAPAVAPLGRARLNGEGAR
jgi:hypothetical protein